MRTNSWSILRRLAILLSGLGLMAAVPAAMAQVQTFMKIDGIPGESTYVGKENWITLTGYSQSFGTADCSRVVAKKRVDRASPLLIARAAANQLIPNVLITMRKAGEAPQDFFAASLDLVMVDRVELADQDGQLVERVVMAPRSITLEYKPQKEDGTFGASVFTTVACPKPK